jgi:hypothetical protein
MQDQLINLLLSQNSYPLGLAHEIGIENAVAVNEILKYAGFSEVSEAELIPRFEKAGLKHFFESRNKLHKLGLLTVLHDESKVQLLESWFKEQDTLQVDIKPTLYQDKEFVSLLTKWKALLFSKGVKRPESYFEELFRGKDAEAVKSALKYSIDNKYTSLYFKDGSHKQSSTGNLGASRGSSNSRTGGGVKESGDRSSKTGGAVHKGFRRLGDE